MIFTNALNGVVVGNLVGKPWDLGSIPRSPPFSILFFLLYFHAAFHSGTTIQLNFWACHTSHNINPMAMI